jgi:hypothetical protein
VRRYTLFCGCLIPSLVHGSRCPAGPLRQMGRRRGPEAVEAWGRIASLRCPPALGFPVKAAETIEIVPLFNVLSAGSHDDDKQPE